MKLFAKLILSFLLIAGICGPASASTIYYEFQIDVTALVSGTNDLGLTEDSVIDVYLQLDNSVTGSGSDSNYTTHEPQDYTDWDDFVLEITIDGTTTYYETDDVGYENYPNVTVNLPSWDFYGLELLTDDFFLYIDEDFGVRLTSVFQDNGDTMPAQYRNDDGTWAILDDSVDAWVVDGQIIGSLAPIPEPATFALFGLALLGLSGISRRRG